MNKNDKLLICPPPRKACGSKSLAFTLAETLIALTVLGVIAAVIIPGVIRNFQKRTYVTQLQRWYADFSNAIDEYVVYNDNQMESFSGSKHYKNPEELDNTNFIKFLDSKYGDLYNHNANLQTQTTNLWKNSKNQIVYQNLQRKNNYQNPDTNYADYLPHYKTYKTKYGATFGIYFVNENNMARAWIIIVDVNGPKKGPNVIGRDAFNFYIDTSKKTLKPRQHAPGPATFLWSAWDSNSTKMENGCDMSSTHTRNGVLCAKRIMQNGWKMDY